MTTRIKVIINKTYDGDKLKREIKVTNTKRGFYGWKLDNEKLIFIPDEEQQEVIKFIIESKKLGISFYEISNFLNSEDIPALKGGYWYTETVKHIYEKHK